MKNNYKVCDRCKQIIFSDAAKAKMDNGTELYFCKKCTEAMILRRKEDRKNDKT